MLTAPLTAIAMIGPFQFTGWEWVALALATPVVLWAGWPFHRAAAKNLRHRADGHLNHCVAGALASGDPDVAEEKSKELLDAVHRFSRTR